MLTWQGLVYLYWRLRRLHPLWELRDQDPSRDWAKSRTILPLVVHLFTTILAFSLRVSFQVLCGRFLCCSWWAAATLFRHVDFFMRFLFFVFQALQLLLRNFVWFTNFYGFLERQTLQIPIFPPMTSRSRINSLVNAPNSQDEVSFRSRLT